MGQVTLLHLAVTLSAEDKGDGGQGLEKRKQRITPVLTISAWNERGGFCSHFIGQHWSHDTNLTGPGRRGQGEVAGDGLSYKMQRNAKGHHRCHSFGEKQLDSKASLCMQGFS